MVHLGPKAPPARKGAADAEELQDLKPELEHFSDLLTVDAEKLKQISKHFVKELEKGLSKEGGNIPMNVAWVMDYPTGKETGKFLALDMGGTNLRVAEITLDGRRGFDTTQSKYKIPPQIITGTSDELWNFTADCVDNFLRHYHPEDYGKEDVYIGFTFSYPVTQDAINHGVLQRWTKGWDVDGVEGKDVTPLLQAALDQKKVPVKVGAVINDTTGTLVISNYCDPAIEMGCIFGTGCNAAYYDKVGNIPKLEGLCPPDIGPDSWMAINCEYGAFDNDHVVLPRTKYDDRLDLESPRPGQQSFEKMIAGYTLGELLRFILQDLIKQGRIFRGQDVSKLDKKFVMDAEFLAKIELDPFENLSDTETLFSENYGIATTDAERELIRHLAELLGTRASRLSMCGVAAMTMKRNLKTAKAGADGSVFNRYPHFKERAAKALADIFDWDSPYEKDHPITMVAAEDGSGAGAAIIAALSQKRAANGGSLGVKRG